MRPRSTTATAGRAGEAGAGGAGWKELAEDTRINETIRRPPDPREARGGRARCSRTAVVKWLYKDVLHADLDDPMLGLGEALDEELPVRGRGPEGNLAMTRA